MANHSIQFPFHRLYLSCFHVFFRVVYAGSATETPWWKSCDRGGSGGLRTLGEVGGLRRSAKGGTCVALRARAGATRATTTRGAEPTNINQPDSPVVPAFDTSFQRYSYRDGGKDD